MLRSPWLGLLAVLVAGIVGYALSDGEVERVVDEVTVTIRPTRDNGAAWDFGGGLPDPRVRVEGPSGVLATCEAKDVVKLACKVGARAEGVRVVVVDVDSSDDDVIGELALGAPPTGALQLDAAMRGGGGAWQRLQALWIALAVGFAIAGALAVYRRRHA